MKNTESDKIPSRKSGNKFLWPVLFIVIAFTTIWAVISQSRSFSLAAFAAYISGASKPWLAAAVLCMLGFILFEGEALTVICRALDASVSHRLGFIYSASDIFFSAITPSATGGQPACAYFMIKDGVPAVITTIVLIENLALYTVSILLLGMVGMVMRPNIYLSFGLLSQALIVLGYIVLFFLTVFFLMLLGKRELIFRICSKGLHLLCKIKILRHEEEKQQKLARQMQEYAAYAQMIKAHKRTIGTALFFNLLQRASMISVPLFVFLASGGDPAKAADIWVVQCYAVIGSNTVPIPGAMGVSDYIMLDGFSKIIPHQNAVDFELLSRSLSFYICVALCGSIVLIKYCRTRKKERKST